MHKKFTPSPTKCIDKENERKAKNGFTYPTKPKQKSNTQVIQNCDSDTEALTSQNTLYLTNSYRVNPLSQTYEKIKLNFVQTFIDLFQ